MIAVSVVGKHIRRVGKRTVTVDEFIKMPRHNPGLSLEEKGTVADIIVARRRLKTAQELEASYRSLGLTTAAYKKMSDIARIEEEIKKLNEELKRFQVVDMRRVLEEAED